MSSEPVPQRLSDADRDAAVEMLRLHYTEGRLDEDEFAERTGVALSARTAAELQPLFTDLPEPRPAPLAPSFSAPPWSNHLPAEYTPPPVPARQVDALGVAQALVWPVAIGLMILSRGGFWWIFLAVIASVIIGQLRSGQRRQPPPYR